MTTRITEMMVVDTSALVAILEEEDGAAIYAKAIAETDLPLISAATLVELGIVMLNRHGPKATRMVDALIQEGGLQVENVNRQHAQLTVEAYAMYGQGQRAIGLNYGDCFSYALAKATGLSLLFKGRDFTKTDIKAAL